MQIENWEVAASTYRQYCTYESDVRNFYTLVETTSSSNCQFVIELRGLEQLIQLLYKDGSKVSGLEGFTGW